MLKKSSLINFLAVFCCGIAMTSCSMFSGNQGQSRTTGWAFNDPERSYITVKEDWPQDIGPGLVPIEGGSFIMGATQENVYFEWNNTPRQITVSSFFMDECEISNLDYLEYVHWLELIYGKDLPDIAKNALPDTLVWRNAMAYNEPMVEAYFRHPAYRDYPVVGVSWVKARDYAIWRTDRVNEIRLIEAGKIYYDPDQNMDNNFSTDAYLAGNYKGQIDENGFTDVGDEEVVDRISMENGLLLPRYRLPTEAEWEYAALGLIGNNREGSIVERRTYPWNSLGLRAEDEEIRGQFIANFKRGAGDYMGIAGSRNDGFAFPAPIDSYLANDYGLYNMAGNVSEWVYDVYRPLSFQDFADMNAVRGNDGRIGTGTPSYADKIPNNNLDTINDISKDALYQKNFNDGDFKSGGTILEGGEMTPNYTEKMYDPDVTLISDRARVYKGGSWADGPYYLSPSVRRFLDEGKSTSTIGFRCAMNMIAPMNY